MMVPLELLRNAGVAGRQPSDDVALPTFELWSHAMDNLESLVGQVHPEDLRLWSGWRRGITKLAVLKGWPATGAYEQNRRNLAAGSRAVPGSASEEDFTAWQQRKADLDKLSVRAGAAPSASSSSAEAGQPATAAPAKQAGGPRKLGFARPPAPHRAPGGGQQQPQAAPKPRKICYPFQDPNGCTKLCTYLHVCEPCWAVGKEVYLSMANKQARACPLHPAAPRTGTG